MRTKAHQCSRFDRRLVEQHDRNVVLDRKHSFALRALERRAVFDELDFRLAVRAREDFEQLWIDGHAQAPKLQAAQPGRHCPLCRGATVRVVRGMIIRVIGGIPRTPRRGLRQNTAAVIIFSQMRTFALALAVSGALAANVAAQSGGPAESAAYYFLLGRHLESEGDIDEAIAAHRRAIELQPGSAELHAELAGVYARQDRAREALDLAEAALERDPDNREANRVLGLVYAAFTDQRRPIRPGDKPAEYSARAIASLEKARGENMFDSAVELMLGRLYLQSGAYAAAVPTLEGVVADQPGYPEAVWLLSLAYEAAGQIDRALATLQEGPLFYRGRVRLAELLERERRWKEAAEAYAEARAMNPRGSDLTPRYAAALLASGSATEAKKILDAALSKKGRDEDPLLLYLLAASQRQLNDLAAAEVTARKLRTIAPTDPRGMYVLAQILDARRDADGAESALRELLARDPLDAPALNYLGYMFAERGVKLDEAIELVQRALTVEPTNPSYLDSLGWAYFRQGRFDLADAPLTEAAAKLPSNSVVQDHLGDLRYKQERYREAAAAWERSLAGDGDSIDRARIEQKLRDARARLR